MRGAKTQNELTLTSDAQAHGAVEHSPPGENGSSCVGQTHGRIPTLR